MNEIGWNFQDRKTVVIFVAILTLFLISEIFLTKSHFLDDAFIHLRIAGNLMNTGYFSFNGFSNDFSTSSPLYTSVLGVLSATFETPFLPKILNLIVYSLILWLLIGAIFSGGSNIRTSLLLAVLVLAVSPFAVRWLTDGMETSFVALMAMLLGISVHNARNDKAGSRSIGLAMTVLSACAVFLRVEFAYILALACLAILADCISSRSDDLTAALKCGLRRSLPFSIGGIAGITIIFVIFGHILPDTAIAKQGSGEINVLGTLYGVITAHIASSSFGVGMILLWGLSLYASLVSTSPDMKSYILSANAGFIVFIILLVLKQQAIQGVRYFIFVEVFLITLNVLSVSHSMNPKFRIFPATRFLVPIAFLAVVWLAFDFNLLYRISAGRSESFERFVNGHYAYLAHSKGVAWDVGMVGFFTGGEILDPNGLVNGRDIAYLSSIERLEKFAGENVKFAFVNRNQFDTLSQYIEISSWVSVDRFDFPNVKAGNDTHFLLVSPELVKQL